MQAAEVLNQNFLDHNTKDRARNKNLVRMRVVNRNTLNLQLPDGVLVGPGEHEISVYEDHVERVMAQVEPNQAALVEAERHYKLEIAKMIKEKMAAGEERFVGTTDDVLAMIRSRSNARVNELHDRLVKTEPLSIQSSFHKLHDRDVKPLVSAEVLKGSEHPEPQRERQTADQKNMVASVVAVVQAMQQSAQPAQPQGNQGNSNQRR